MSTLKKQCKDCLEYLPLQAFWHDPRYAFKRNYRCRACWRKKRIADADDARDKLAALLHYGRVCQRCGESDTHKLQIDHIDNDGGAQRAAEPSAKVIYRGPNSFIAGCDDMTIPLGFRCYARVATSRNGMMRQREGMGVRAWAWGHGTGRLEAIRP